MTGQTENKIKLTKRVVEGIEPHPSKRLSLWDTEIRGFNIRIYPTGRKVYYIQYRNKNKETRKINIGVHGGISTERARETAQKLALEIAFGRDPAFHTQQVKVRPTMADLCREYIELHIKINKRTQSKRNNLSMINTTILPAFGHMKLEDISAHDLQKLHKDLTNTPYRANRVKALLSKLFNLAIEWSWHHENPAQFVKKYQEEKRTRWLNEEELSRLWKTLDSYHNQSISTAIKLLLLTGARKHEVLSAQWKQFDLERGVWTKPSHMTKQKREEHLPLSSSALLLLKNWKSYSSSPFLFIGKLDGKPITDIKGAWKTIRKMAELEDVRIHDLRHTYASHLVSSGLSLSIVGKLLGHTQAGTTQRYAHLADESLRKATAVFGDKIDEIVKKAG